MTRTRLLSLATKHLSPEPNQAKLSLLPRPPCLHPPQRACHSVSPLSLKAARNLVLTPCVRSAQICLTNRATLYAIVEFDLKFLPVLVTAYSQHFHIAFGR